jgi:hypothetical protein
MMRTGIRGKMNKYVWIGRMGGNNPLSQKDLREVTIQRDGRRER